MYPSLNSSTISEAAVYLNTVSNGLFWTLMLFVSFIIMVAVFSYLRSEKSLLISSFLTSIISILLRSADLIGVEPIFASVLGTFILLIISYNS